ncbi:MBL fold metallo-hydrolase [Desulfosediminicola sp.]|uniref:MBL fold metallo-hydrolase n=1 Tax=Desulfosediminicola sp. TaxID=2886825 RepID=UPI003AF25092
MISKILESITWLGHDGFMIRDDTRTIVIDPYQISGGEPADIILITHDHYDHCSPEDIAKIQDDSTIIVTEAASAKKLSGDIRVMQPGDSLELNGVTIEAVPAYNINKKFHPKKNNWLGFVITVGGCRIYHAGDTDLIDEMADLKKIDIALLPVSGTYVMTAEEAVAAAMLIKPQVAIPMHYDSLVGTRDDAEQFADKLTGVCETKILSCG